MKEIPLTQGQVTIVDDEDFEWLMKNSWCVNSAGYAFSQKGLMHRRILKARKGEVVDHINHDPLDNRRCNIRLGTQSANMMNRRKTIREGFTSKYRGVAHRGGKNKKIENDRGYVYTASKPWVAYYGKNYLGITKTEKEAANLYDLAALRDRGPGAQLNFPVEGLSCLEL